MAVLGQLGSLAKMLNSKVGSVWFVNIDLMKCIDQVGVTGCSSHLRNLPFTECLLVVQRIVRALKSRYD